MRVTFVRGIEAVFFAVILALIVGIITMIVHATDLESPAKPESLAEWDKRDLETMQQEITGAAKTAPEDLEALGFEPPGAAGPPPPANTIAYNDIASNLLNMLHHYYFLPGDRMRDESVEYVDRETGYFKLGQKIFDPYSLGHIAKHVKYLLALAKYQALYPTNVSFAEDYAKMDALIREIFSDLPDYVFQIETFFDLIELNRITGEERYADYANMLNESGNWQMQGEAFALMVQRASPRTIKPQFISSVLLLQYYAEHGNPLLAESAGTLYNGIISDTYAPQYKMFYTQGSSPQPGDIKGTAIAIFHTMEQAIALKGMMDYAGAAGNDAILETVREIFTAVASGGSEIVDSTNGGFYTKFQEKSSRYTEEDKRADVNLMMYSALVQYLKYDANIQEIVRRFSYQIEQLMYDDLYNGFYSRYKFDWTPEPVDGVYELCLSDTILAAQIYLDQEELVRELRAGGS